MADTSSGAGARIGRRHADFPGRRPLAWSRRQGGACGAFQLAFPGAEVQVHFEGALFSALFRRSGGVARFAFWTSFGRILSIWCCPATTVQFSRSTLIVRNLSGYPLAIPNPLAMQVLFDKERTHQLCGELGIPVVSGRSAEFRRYGAALAGRFGLPIGDEATTVILDRSARFAGQNLDHRKRTGTAEAAEYSRGAFALLG